MAETKSQPEPSQASSEEHTNCLELELILAASEGNLEDVKELVEERQVNVDAADYDGRTALHLAAETGQKKVIEYLLDKGANPNVVDRWYKSVIRGAQKNNHSECVSILREGGASSHCEVEKELSTSDQKQNELKELAFNFFNKLDPNWEQKGSIDRNKFVQYMHEQGLETHSKKAPYMHGLIQKLCDESGKRVIFSKFENEMLHERNRLTRAVTEDLVISKWSSFVKTVRQLFKEVNRDINQRPKEERGKNASYIPELEEFKPSNFAISLITVDGQVLNLGDYDVNFPIESCSKPLTYSHAIELYGYNQVHQHVGKEPSGVSFNSFTLNYENKPHNACINSGAMAVCALYHAGERPGVRFKQYNRFLTKMSGNVVPSFNQSVYLSERDTAHTNFALAHYMKAKNGFPVDTQSEIIEALNFYFQTCSVDVTCYSLARMASTWANGGINPHTMEKILTQETCKRTSQLMMACGMYDYSGEWSCTIGLPAKSGVGGSIYTVVPGVCAFCVYSPPLDRNGNSVKGIELSKRLVNQFRWSIFDHFYDDLNKA